MKIINVSAKVIGVLGKDLMPDQSIDCNEDTIKNESVAALIAMGFLKLDNQEEMEKAMKEAMREEILAEMAAEKDAPKRGRKPKVTEDEADAEA